MLFSRRTSTSTLFEAFTDGLATPSAFCIAASLSLVAADPLNIRTNLICRTAPAHVARIVGRIGTTPHADRQYQQQRHRPNQIPYLPCHNDSSGRRIVPARLNVFEMRFSIGHFRGPNPIGTPEQNRDGPSSPPGSNSSRRKDCSPPPGCSGPASSDRPPPADTGIAPGSAAPARETRRCDHSAPYS